LTEELDKEEKTATIITKMAKTDYPINELISRRWSARAFSTKPVEKSKLLSLLEAARWAPSSRNEQPWRYIVFTNDNPEKLKKAHSDNGIPNRLHFHDLGAANENMFLEAFNQGLIMHEMGGFDVQKAREVFNIPEDYEIGIMIAIGLQDTYHVLPQRIKEKAFTPRVRKPLSEIAFIEEVGNGIV
jgi:nitroreductase